MMSGISWLSVFHHWTETHKTSINRIIMQNSDILEKLLSSISTQMMHCNFDRAKDLCVCILIFVLSISSEKATLYFFHIISEKREDPHQQRNVQGVIDYVTWNNWYRKILLKPRIFIVQSQNYNQKRRTSLIRSSIYVIFLPQLFRYIYWFFSFQQNVVQRGYEEIKYRCDKISRIDDQHARMLSEIIQIMMIRYQLIDLYVRNITPHWLTTVTNGVLTRYIPHYFHCETLHVISFPSYNSLYTLAGCNKHLKIEDLLTMLKSIIDNHISPFTPTTFSSTKTSIE